jgi:predicted transcriptional regulator
MTATLQLTAGIVTSFVERNRIAISDLPDLIGTVHRALAAIEPGAAPEAPELKKATPAQIRKSITPEALISFEDGKPYRMLKRHLTKLGLTPEAYRSKWGLPTTYPMTAASYAEKRSAFAKAAGLGLRTRGGSAV